MKSTILAALALALTSGSVLAADAYDRKGGASVKEVSVATSAERSWTGIWLGAFGGYTMTNTELSLDHFYNGDGDVTKSNIGKVDGLGGEGLFGELQLGADKQIGRLVVGAYGFYGISGSETTAHINGKQVGTIEEDTGYGGAVRLGALLNNNNLVYVAGGYRWLDVDINVGSMTREEQLEGFFGEVGLESRLTSISDNAYFRLSGRYTAFDDLTFSNRAEKDCWEELNAEPGKLEIMGGLLFKVGGGSIGLE